MKRICLCAAFLAVAAALADFDASAWEVRRESMSREAARMEADYARYAALAREPAENVTVPFETYASGNVKSTVHAKRAQFFHDDDCVWAEGVTLEQFREDGSVDIRLVARNGLVDRRGKCCWISGPAKVTHRGTTLEGEDAFYCSSNGFLKVMSNVRVVSEDIKMKGLKL